MKSKIIIIFALFLLPFVSDGGTVYEYGSGISESEYFIDYPISGSGVNQIPIIQWDYYIPANITFNKVQIGVIDSLTSYSGTVSFRPIAFNGDASWECLNQQCGNNRTDWGAIGGTVTKTYPTNGTIQLNFTETYTSSSSVDAIRVTFNDSDITVRGNSKSRTAGLNFSAWTIFANGYAPFIKFCMNECDSDTFDASADIFNNSLTKITDANVSTATTSKVKIDVDYFINTPELTVGNRPDSVLVNVTSEDTTQFESKGKIILPLNQGASSTVIFMDETYPDGNYTAMVTFWNITNNNTTFSTGFSVNFTVSSGAVISSVIASGDEIYFPDGIYVQENCGITDFSCHLKNALFFMFVPSPESIAKFTTINSQLETKFPFVFAYQFQDSIGSLYNGSSTASSTISYDFAGIGTMTLLSVSQLNAVPYTAWLRVIIGYLMWLMFAVLMYNRTLKVFNSNPQ